MNSKLSQNLRTLMNETKLSESELSRRTGVAQPIIHRMLDGNNKNPKIATLNPIAKYFQVTISQLIGDEHLSHIHAITSTEHKGWSSLPLITWKDALHWHEIMNNYKALSKYPMVFTDFNVTQKAFGLEVKDSSMEPKFSKGTILIIEPEKQPKDRDFVIVNLNNHPEAIFKQVLIDGVNHHLRSLSTEINNNIIISSSDKYIGIVVQSRTDYEDK